jgi:hypothetical protein
VDVAARLGEDLDDADCPVLEVDVVPAERGHLPDAEATVGAEQHQRAVLGPDSVGEPADLSGGEKPDLLMVDLGELDTPAGRPGDHARVDRGRPGPA